METEKISIKKSSIQYGVIMGLILSLITVAMYAINPDSFLSIWIGVGTLLLVIVISIIATAKAKSILDGIMTFKEAFSAYFISIAVGLLISTVVGILIFAVLDPELGQRLNEQTVEMSREFMENWNMPEADMEKALAEMEGVDNFSVFNQLKSYIFRLVGFAVLGLLIALIFRQKDPNAIDA